MRQPIKLPTDPQERKTLAKAIVSLSKLPAEKRKEVLQSQVQKRGLQPK
jgi:hypothetical protein